MDHLELLQLGGKVSWGLFVFALGACVGSLTNVLVYRLPLGLDVMTAPSRCPQCGTRLTWRENIPVLGWLFLRGRCRFCRSSISPEYPMVEAFTGLLFVSVFTLWYLLPQDAHWLGINWGAARPDWAVQDAFDGFPRTTWGPLVAVLVLLGSLVAMTLVDAKTFTIPLQIPWFATVVGILFHTASAALVGELRTHSPNTNWALPQPGGSAVDSSSAWWWIGASFGAVAGLVISNGLVHFGLIRRSFADYQDWEDKTLQDKSQPAAESSPQQTILPNAASQPELNTAGPVGEQAGEGARLALRFILIGMAVITLATAVGWAVSRNAGHIPQWSGLAVGVLVAPFIAALAVRRRVQAMQAPGPACVSPTDLWIQYPHARREMFKELIFLTPCIGLAWLGGWWASHLGESSPPHVPPFWLVVLAATLMGYLIGAAVVWGFRIGGTLAFNKEAIGLGDVHLMGAVGACVGWIDAALAFPLAAMVGLYCTAVVFVSTGTVARALPFGPYLAGATALVVLGKPLVEMGLTWLLGAPPGQPVNLP